MVSDSSGNYLLTVSPNWAGKVTPKKSGYVTCSHSEAQPPEECPVRNRAPVRVANWNDTKDTPYRVLYRDSSYSGTIRKDPKDKPEIVNWKWPF